MAALAAAARETKAANQAARVALWNLEPGRLQTLNGLLSVPGTYLLRPHDVALGQLQDLCRAHQTGTAALYENMARAYAYGTAEALSAVLQGEQPPFVELWRDEAGNYSVTLKLLPDFRESLAHWSGGLRLTTLGHDVDNREIAADVVRDCAPHEDLDESEITELTEAHDLAAGLADSLHVYGEQAEAALHFVLTSGASQ